MLDSDHLLRGVEVQAAGAVLIPRHQVKSVVFRVTPRVGRVPNGAEDVDLVTDLLLGKKGEKNMV